MKLTRLRLIGFKSFVEPTDFLIEPGLTGVVGPNGCGKSNLVEALRWVMGESSHKSMRASSMDDVIFSGSNSRPARNNAEVAIAIDNIERSAPAAFNDQDSIDIARRIERESGSSYRINGREVRARDVQILFADASTGARSPALVHQGRIGEIIQAKPEQRRRVLEEAAGVAGLHARRHEAELRLKAAETNLLRLEDVIGQLAAQMDGLKKQAKPGDPLPHGLGASAQERGDALPPALDRRQRRGRRRRAGQGRLPARGGRSHGRASGSFQTADARRRRVARACARPRRAPAPPCIASMSRAQDLDREEQRAKDRIAELELRLQQFAADGERERRLAADAEEALARLAAEEETIRSEARESAGRRSGVDAKLAEADTELSAAETIFAELTATLADLTAQRHQLENAAREHGERAVRLDGEIAAIEAELTTLQGTSGPDLAALAAAVDEMQAAIAAAETAAVEAEAATRRGPRATRGVADAARGRRAPRAAAGDGSQNPVKGARGREQEFVAAGDGSHLGRERLREGARRCSRRRSRRAGGSVGANALDGLGYRS